MPGGIYFVFLEFVIVPKNLPKRLVEDNMVDSCICYPICTIYDRLIHES